MYVNTRPPDERSRLLFLEDDSADIFGSNPFDR